MRAAGEQVEAGKGIRLVFRLGQDAPADGHNRIGRQNPAAFHLLIRTHDGKRGLGLFTGEALGERARIFRALRRLVDIHRQETGGLDARLREEFDAARRTRGKNEGLFARHGIRHEIGRCAGLRRGAGLSETVGDTALGEVVGRHFDENLVAGQNTDAVLPHAARGVGDDFMFVFQLHAEGRVGQEFGHDSREFENFFFCHSDRSFLHGL